MKNIFEVTESKPGLRRWEYKQKNSYSCGYYCARAIVNSLGDGNDKNLKPLLKLTADGVRQNNLIRTLRARQVGASVHYDLTLSRMDEILRKGKYIIVYHHDLEHWLVLAGIEGKMMRFYDPEEMWNYEDSDRVFDVLDNFGIVCSAKGQ